MSRPIRIEVEDGWCHVISRGLVRRDIFRDDSERSDLLERLFGLSESHAVLVHAYCLMKNHFHLQAQTRQANLKQTMQRLLSGYAVRFNLRYRRAGPLFQGRYRAILAGEQDCITEVNRYIHLNPVRLESLDLGKQWQAEIRRGIEDPVDEELVRRRLELPRAYPWSHWRTAYGHFVRWRDLGLWERILRGLRKKAVAPALHRRYLHSTTAIFVIAFFLTMQHTCRCEFHNDDSEKANSDPCKY